MRSSMHQSSPVAVRVIFKMSILHNMRLISVTVLITFVLAIVIINSTTMVLSLPSPPVISSRCGGVLAPLKLGRNWWKSISMMPMLIYRLCGITTIGRFVGMREWG